ncbi:MAG: gliding motility-associated C-terminal domain-containing protein [Chitinophagaceae bacterium]|nr:gliding motility-associated C-terminal domain-containing protein [Chitinophagaceae bacterium]
MNAPISSSNLRLFNRLNFLPVMLLLGFLLGTPAKSQAQRMFFADAQGRLAEYTWHADTMRLVDSFFLKYNGTDIGVFSICQLKDTIYFTSNNLNGGIYRWAKNSTSKQVELLPSSTIGRYANSMAISPEGIIYMADHNPFINQQRPFWSYDTRNMKLTRLGDLPFAPTGDFMFYKDKLLMASYFMIAEIDIANPSASKEFMQTGNEYLFYGLISIPKNCAENRYYGLRPNSLSNAIELDLENKILLGKGPYLELTVYDGASSYDIGANLGPAINNISFNGICNPANALFDMQINATIADNMPISYSINGNPPNKTGFFSAQPFQQYHIQVAAENGCTADTSFVLEPVALATTPVVQPTQSCTRPNGSINLQAKGNYPPFQYLLQSGVWSRNPVFDSLSAGIYSVGVKNSFGCVHFDTVIVSNEAWFGRVNALQTTPALCTANNGTLNITMQGSYNTVMTAVNGSTPAQKFSYDKLFPGIHKLTLFDGDCRFDTLFNIGKEVTNPPVWQVLPTHQLCKDDNGSLAVQLANALKPYYTTSLNGNDFLASWQYSKLAPGRYSLRIRDSAGCAWEDSIQIQPYLQPTATVLANTTMPDCDVPNGGRISVQLSGGRSPYTFTDSSGQIVGNNSLLQTGLKTGVYNYKLINADGCTEATLSYPLPFNRTGRCDYFYVPNAFTPNADRLNDYLRPQYSILYQEVRFTIFNRYGEIVYEHQDGKAGWDGNYKGKQLPAGAYIWSSTYLDMDGNQKKLKGSVMLIR